MNAISAKTFNVQLFAQDATSSRAVRRVIVNADLLKSAKLSAGDVLALSPIGNTRTSKGQVFAIGIAWPSHEVAQGGTLFYITEFLKLTSPWVAEGDKVTLNNLNGTNVPPGFPSLRQAQEPRIIRLCEVSTDGSFPQILPDAKNRGEHRDWLPILVKEALVDIKYVTLAQTLEVAYEGRRRRFSIRHISTQNPGSERRADDLTAGLGTLSLQTCPKLWVVGWDTEVAIVDDAIRHANAIRSDREKERNQHPPPSAYATVGGLDKQISQIRDLIEIPLTRPELFRHFGLKPPRGILLHGSPGTGKTHLARAIASSTGSSVLIVNGPELSSAYHGETESKLRDVFAEARTRSPCIVVLDEVDALCPRREDGPGGEVEKRVVAQLLTIMDGMENESKETPDGGAVVVVATTNRPNAIDPALRRPGRFDREIEIGIPDAQARSSILKVLLQKSPHSLSEVEIENVAARAHGYVGADLSAVVREAGTLAIKRHLAAHSPESVSCLTSSADEPAPELTLQDLLISLPTVRPSALRSLFLDTVPVRYSDIGGQASTIQRLRECIEWPLLYPDAFERLGIRPPKGVLLYGPPGCSKTLLVRACATESGVNFVAVKGPELLNKYVGESERAVRDIFSKARAAAPSIIFFDEIDALATSRSGSEGSGGSHEGVLTSLLNEMDGVQELVGVTVVAATNRPEAIDSALMRPGRIDRILFVGPPDHAGREEILRIRIHKMKVEADLDISALARLTDGCSGAEIAALCQEAALLTMKKDINAPYVPHDAFYTAARNVKKQITPEVSAMFENWRQRTGLTEV